MLRTIPLWEYPSRNQGVRRPIAAIIVTLCRLSEAVGDNRACLRSNSSGIHLERFRAHAAFLRLPGLASRAAIFINAFPKGLSAGNSNRSFGSFSRLFS